jgi:hypothetical protein
VSSGLGPLGEGKVVPLGSLGLLLQEGLDVRGEVSDVLSGPEGRVADKDKKAEKRWRRGWV